MGLGRVVGARPEGIVGMDGRARAITATGSTARPARAGVGRGQPETLPRPLMGWIGDARRGLPHALPGGALMRPGNVG